ncbi:MAG: hypothetical protein HYR94_25000 [Chloroflexi bacterium]|nr:hypothetical protein [Chloroflexota bacterium]
MATKTLQGNITVPSIDLDASSGGFEVPTNVTVGTKNVNIGSIIKDAFPLLQPLPIIPTVNVPVPDIDFSSQRIKAEPKTITVTMNTFSLPEITITKNRTNSTLLEVPIDIDVDWENRKLETLVNVNFSLSLGWRNGELGIIVTHGRDQIFFGFQ